MHRQGLEAPTNQKTRRMLVKGSQMQLGLLCTSKTYEETSKTQRMRALRVLERQQDKVSEALGLPKVRWKLFMALHSSY